MKNSERLKRNFINYALQKNFNLSVDYDDGALKAINIKDENDVVFCTLSFAEHISNAPVLISYTKYISLDSVDKLASLFQKIIDLYEDLNDETV